METMIADEPQEIVPVVYPSTDVNPALVYLGSLSASSRRPMRKSLQTIAALVMGDGMDELTFPWGQLRYQHTQAIRAMLQDGSLAASTANRHLSALRGVLKDAWRLGYMTAEAYQRAVDVKTIRGEQPDQAAGRALSVGEILALFNDCATDANEALGVRDAAMIAIAYVGGLRRAEIASLTLTDFDRAGSTLFPRGKRNKVRSVPIQDNGAAAALEQWLALRDGQDGPLFTRVLKGGRVLEAGITDQAIYTMLQTRAKRAGVRAFSPHDLRRTFAGDLLDAGADISTVQKLMGHANANTTAGYDRRGERAKREAVGRLHAPWQCWRGESG